MILQERIEKRKSIEIQKPTGKVTESLTIPGQGVDLAYAMEQYKRGSLVDRAIAFYEDEKLPMPDFNSMSRVEKLGALAEYRKEAARLKNVLNNDYKHKTDVIEKHNHAKAAKEEAESKRAKRNPDRDDQPNAK